MMPTDSNKVPRTPAERMRRYRARKQSAQRVLPVRVTDAELDLIAARGYEGAKLRDDPKALTAAVEAYISDSLFFGDA